MSAINRIIATGLLPDRLLRMGIRRRLTATLKQIVLANLEAQAAAVKEHADGLRTMPVAINTADANEQHYELPSGFFARCLGPRMKYSACLFETGNETLAEAEEAMLDLTCRRAELEDGQRILELGCGWGSLSLWMAERYPRAEITSVSNSASQKEHIDHRARELGITNLQVITENMTDFAPDKSNLFDRVVSVEMFEHMKNYAVLMERIATWLAPHGKLFIHIFTHKKATYHYIAESDDDWMAKYFFTGGQMPSDDLLLHFQDHLKIESHWRISGTHYQRTSEYWLKNMDANKSEIMAHFIETYGEAEARKWFHYWRVFYLACAELWGYHGGEEWMVSHYLFAK